MSLRTIGVLIYCSPPQTQHHPTTIPQGISSFLLKPYIKVVTQFCEVEWWRTLMLECVTVFDYMILHQILRCKWGFKLSQQVVTHAYYDLYSIVNIFLIFMFIFDNTMWWFWPYITHISLMYHQDQYHIAENLCLSPI